MFNPVAPNRYLLRTIYSSVADNVNPDLLACGCPTWISLNIGRFYEEQCQSSSGSAWSVCPKIGNWTSIAGAVGVTQFAQQQAAMKAPRRVGCVGWNHYLLIYALHPGWDLRPRDSISA